MKDLFENKFSMYFAVEKICDKNINEIATISIFEQVYGFFKGNNSEIQKLNILILDNLKGVAQDKKTEEQEMINKTLEVAAVLYTYASINNDNSLKEEINYSHSKLKQMRDTDLLSACLGVHNKAVELEKNVEGYGLINADITDLKKEIEDFKRILADPRTAITTRSRANAMLAELFKENDKILKEQMDKLMIQFKEKNKAFYLDYNNARTIVDLGVRHENEVELETN